LVTHFHLCDSEVFWLFGVIASGAMHTYAESSG
jgi:hypothetical protein